MTSPAWPPAFSWPPARSTPRSTHAARAPVGAPRPASCWAAGCRSTPPTGPAYDRDAFGSPWADTDGDGCNQRDDVLLRDASRTP